MDDDYNSLWTIKEANRETVKTYCTYALNQTISLNVEMQLGYSMHSPKETFIPSKYTNQWSQEDRRSQPSEYRVKEMTVLIRLAR